MNLFVIKQNALDDLWRFATGPGGPDRYRGTGPVVLHADCLLPSPIHPAGETPILRVNAADRADSDIDNAIALHRWLPLPDDSDARDNRLWTWLAHVPFADYTRARWPIPLGDHQNPKTVSSIQDHWILRGEGRGTVRRHAISRLWWAAHLTCAPWKHSEDFAVFRQADDYHYTRILFESQDTYQQLVERSFGGSRLILVSALHALGDIKKGRDVEVRWLSVELNMISRYRDLSRLAPARLTELISEIIASRRAPPPAHSSTNS